MLQDVRQSLISQPDLASETVGKLFHPGHSSSIRGIPANFIETRSTSLTVHRDSQKSASSARSGLARRREITLDHLPPSLKLRADEPWKKENEELELAKECEAMIERGLNDLAKRRRKEQEKMRLLQEVAELFKTDWPIPKGVEAGLALECGKTDGLTTTYDT